MSSPSNSDTVLPGTGIRDDNKRQWEKLLIQVTPTKALIMMTVRCPSAVHQCLLYTCPYLVVISVHLDRKQWRLCTSYCLTRRPEPSFLHMQDSVQALQSVAMCFSELVSFYILFRPCQTSLEDPDSHAAVRLIIYI